MHNEVLEAVGHRRLGKDKIIHLILRMSHLEDLHQGHLMGLQVVLLDHQEVVVKSRFIHLIEVRIT